MRNAAILIFIGIGLLYSIGNRFGSILFYWWFAVFRPQDWIYLDVSALRLSLVVGVFVVAGCLLTGQFPLVRGPLPILMLILLVLEAVGTFTAGCPHGWTKWESLARMFLLLFFTARLTVTPRQIMFLLLVVGMSLGFFASKAGFFSLLADGASQYGAVNLGGSFSGSNAFALGTAVAIFYMLACALNVSWITRSEGTDLETSFERVSRWAIFGCILLSAFNIASLSSRGSSVALILGAIIFVVQRGKSIKLALKLAPIALIVVMVVPLPDGFTERMESVFADKEDLDASASSRPHLWAVAREITKIYPLGIGSQCYIFYYDRFDSANGLFGSRRAVHSSHFQILTEAGYLGFAVWIGLFVTSTLQLWRVRKRSRTASIGVARQRFLATTSSAMFCSIVTFGVGSSFYETAHMELIWLSFLITSLLANLSIRMVAEAASDVRHESDVTQEVRSPRPSIYRGRSGD
jgi:putative inorganic carbon (hco3(-)) transporter